MADEAKPLFEFCVEGVAISGQSKNHARLKAWRDRVAQATREVMAGAAIIEDVLEVRLTEFSETRSRDRDNFAKPILDAMEKIAYRNDRQVDPLTIEWRDINGRYRVRFMSRVVAQALVTGHEFVWIRIYRHRPRETLI